MIPVGVVGVGSMGRHHARVYRELPGAELVGIHDADEKRAAGVAAEQGTQSMELPALLDAVEAVSVVVPTPYHREVAEAATDAGTSLLVEKPLAGTPRDARAIVDAAEEAGVTLQVGHVERFNPAVQAVSEFADELDIVALEAQRLGPPVDRAGDDGAVMDLMIHDIDIALSLLGESVVDVRTTGTADGEHVTSMLTFEGGSVATLTASRITQKKVRTLALTAADCRVDVDYTSQDVTITRQTTPEYIEANGGLRFRSETVVERPTVKNGEPLKAELASFVDCVRTGTPPEVTGEDGLRALEVAGRVLETLTHDGSVEWADQRTHS
ncbi:Gfo/Idh/MocA family protein [Natronomonas gomsonensis]|uniref:Gfo/Idh/MocA family protein n=1 Tax=Natronomonas gomsonensis TaxID=1046043 RepID=UPI0015C19DCC|nr:Gfo/Idh/MocA family oxidoreductase [Natronomonas gomsonensis]